MSIWDSYPQDYRANEVHAITSAVGAGECVSVVGLSGSGKSNLMGFLAHRSGAAVFHPVLVDGNRLVDVSPTGFFGLLCRAVGHALGDESTQAGDLAALEAVIERQLAQSERLCLLFDRFDAIPALPGITNNLRALRDRHKYALTYVTATRRPLDPRSELAELFFAHTLWLGPLSADDARWNVLRYAERRGLVWEAAKIEALVRLSWGYPSLLRAACEAAAEGCPIEEAALREHVIVRRRVEEFWADHPSEDDLRRSGLAGHPWLMQGMGGEAAADAQLTAKEHLLLAYLRAHPNQVCEKDDLIRAVWPEDKIYTRGIRDDSLAQLVRRLREKVEADASHPRHIHTVPGRGYRYTA